MPFLRSFVVAIINPFPIWEIHYLLGFNSGTVPSNKRRIPDLAHYFYFTRRLKLHSPSILVKAIKANRYESGPKPAIVPFATPEITDVCRNSSRDIGFER